MSDVRSRDGATIAFERSGAGPAVVFVGGALTTASAMAPLAALLSARCEVFVYDRRGRGSSGDTEPYAVEREVEDLAAVLEVAGGRASVYGHSSGAVLALEAASRGLPIERLALYEPPFVVDDCRPPLPPDYVAQLTDLVAGDRRGDAIEYFMTTGAAAPADTVASMRSAPFWPAMEAIAHTLAYDGAVMGDTMSGRPLQGERWASVTMPTLVMDGGASPDWARNAARALAAVLPNARYLTLEGQTHGVTDEAHSSRVGGVLRLSEDVAMRFRATIQLNGKTATGIPVPAKVVEELGKGKRPPVQVTIGAHTYRSTVAAYGDGFMLPLSAEHRTAAGVAAGDVVDVEVTLDTAPREVEVPEDFAAALAAEPSAEAFFGGLSYSLQRWHVESIEGAKAAETRQRRIDKSMSLLREGKAR